ncbi:MAG: YafY family transcriptional regulator [Anaerolineae bacterium]|nr:YafY family transcriptional regulator [Anaerolineae bacterium]
MRADRLLSMLMLLQSRGQMTAHDLADELEVSVRTIYRDLDALSAAGVPVYAERGPGGGCALLDSYRTTLTGLTQDEVRALFMLSIPAPLAELGMDGELRAALFKLAASLPTSRRPDEARARQRIHLDSAGWFESREPVPLLQTLHRALWQERRVHMRYQLPFETQACWVVEPYGLVAKASTWYLVCARRGHIHAYRVSQVLAADILEEPFEYPAGFDLAAFWRTWCLEVEGDRPRYPVTLRVNPDLIPWLRHLFGEEITYQAAGTSQADGEGWMEISLVFESLEEARRRILGFGGAVEVLAPRPLRESVRDHAQQILGVYGGQRI